MRWPVDLCLTVAACGLLACGGQPEPIKLSYGGSDGRDSFRVANASPSDWAEARVAVAALRLDGVEQPCHEQTFASWPVGLQQTLPRCGEKTLITLQVGGQTATFTVSGDSLYQRLGRREIKVE